MAESVSFEDVSGRSASGFESTIADILASEFYTQCVGQLRQSLCRLSEFDRAKLREAAVSSWVRTASVLRGRGNELLAEHVSCHIERVRNEPLESSIFLLFFYPDHPAMELRFWCPANPEIVRDLGVPYSEPTMVHGIPAAQVLGLRYWTFPIEPGRPGLLGLTGPEYQSDLTEDQIAGRTTYPEGDWLVGVKSVVYLPISKTTGFIAGGPFRWEECSTVICVCSSVPKLFGGRSYRKYATNPRLFNGIVESFEAIKKTVGFVDALRWFVPLEEQRALHDVQLRAAYCALDHELRNNFLRLESLVQRLSGVEFALDPEATIDEPVSGTAWVAVGALPLFRDTVENLRTEIARFRELVTLFKGEPLKRNRTIDLNDVVRATIQRLKADRFDRNGTAFDVNLSTTSLPVLTTTTGELLVHATENILANAATFAQGRMVMVATRADSQQGRAYFECCDSGPGFPRAIVPKLFTTPFFSVRLGNTKGLGIGLYLCRKYAEAHEGTSFAENRPEGGARVGFWVPLARAPGGGDNHE